MDDNASFRTILESFGLSVRAIDRFTEDYPTARDLMNSTEAQVKEVISSQNKTFRHHATAAQRCYVNATQTTRIYTLRTWSTYAVKEGGAVYDVADVATFNLAWINGLQDDFNQATTDATTPGATNVKVPKFDGQNWYDVKAAFTMALSSIYGQSGVPLSYLIRSTRLAWEDTAGYSSIQQRRIDTKAHSGADFNMDNVELYRILGQEFSRTTLNDVVKAVQHSNGVRAWNDILDNVEGNNYRTELRRKAEALITNAFYNPSRNFSFEDYFQKHARYHDMMSKAGAPVSDWQKIEKFMQGVKCQSLQTVYITSTMANREMTFTQFYNDIHEKYRRLVDSKQIKPASIYTKRKISSISTDSRGGGGRGGRGRGRGHFGRGRGRNAGRGRGRGQNANRDSINWSILPAGVTPNGNLDFDDNEWYNFPDNVREEIKKLRRLQQRQRNINSMMNSSSYQARNQYGDDSTVTDRSIFSVHVPNQQGPPLPPPPSNNNPIPPSVPVTPPANDGRSTQSNNAGRAFGRRGGSTSN